MPNINLIAARRAEKKRLELLTRQLFFGLAGSVAAFIGVGMVLTAMEFSSRSELREAEATMQTLQPKLDKIAQIEADQQVLQPKVDTLQSAKIDTLRWRAVLQAVSQSIPGDTWLSGLSTTGDAEDITINMTGVTASQSQVGETMTRLGVHPLFDGVELKYTSTVQAQPGDKQQKVTFEIAAHLRGLPKPEDKKKDGAEGDAATQKAQAPGGTGNAGGNNG